MQSRVSTTRTERVFDNFCNFEFVKKKKFYPLKLLHLKSKIEIALYFEMKSVTQTFWSTLNLIIDEEN